MNRIVTLVWLRHRLWWNGLRSNEKVADTAVAVILAVVGAVASLALAAALAFVLHIGLSRGDAESQRVALLIAFWMLAFLAVGLPVFFSVAQRGVPPERLLIYPLSWGELYRVSLAGSLASGAHFFWYPSLLALTFVAFVLNRLPPVAWVAVTVVLSVCLVVWCHTILLLVQRVLRQRRMRELVALTGLVLVVTASILPAVIESRRGDADPASLPIPKTLTSATARVSSVLPPSIAVKGVVASAKGEGGGTVASIGWLVVWTSVGVAVGSVLFRRLLLAGGGGPHVKSAAPAPRRQPGVFSIDGWDWLPAAVRAVAARDLHYLFRSTVGKFNIVIMPVFVAMMGLLVARDLTGPVLGVDRSNIVFLGIMVYASMFSNNFLYNAYAWEGSGIRSYFISPVSARQVILGKNLGLWIFNLILAAEAVVAYAAIVGLPVVPVAISGCLAFAAGLLASTIAGNFVSPALPVARDISKIGNSPSQTGILVSFGMLIAIMLLIGGLALIAALAGSPWLQPVFILVLVAIEIAVYQAMLSPAAELLERRKETLVEAVQAPS